MRHFYCFQIIKANKAINLHCTYQGYTATANNTDSENGCYYKGCLGFFFLEVYQTELHTPTLLLVQILGPQLQNYSHNTAILL